MRPDFTWEGAVNARPIAGDIHRMGRREWLTASGWEQLKADGVRTVIDLRLPSERGKRATDPEVAAAAMAGIDIIELPLEDEGKSQYWALCQPYMNSPAHYVHVLNHFPERVAAVFSALADAPGAVVLHCSAGRDRTGLVATMLVALLGGGDDAFDQDRQAVEGINKWRLVAPTKHPYEFHMGAEQLEASVAARALALRSFLQNLDVREFLVTNGVTEKQLDEIAQRCS